MKAFKVQVEEVYEKGFIFGKSKTVFLRCI